MSTRHSPSNGQIQVSKTEFCDREFLSKTTSTQRTGPIRDERDVGQYSLHKLGLHFHRHCCQTFDKERRKENCTKFDAVIIEVPAASDRTGTSRTHNMRTNETNIVNNWIFDFPYFCEKVLKYGPYIVLLCVHYMIMPRISSFTNAGFSVIPYPYTFVSGTTTVPDRQIFGFSKNVCNFAVVAKTTGRHPGGFQPNINDWFVNANCFSLKNSAVISNIFWWAKKLMKPETRKSLWKTEKSIGWTYAIIQLLTRLDSNFIDLYGKTLPDVIYGMDIKQSFTSIEKKEVYFSALFQWAFHWQNTCTLILLLVKLRQ